LLFLLLWNGSYGATAGGNGNGATERIIFT